jgi:hypothetical protein
MNELELIESWTQRSYRARRLMAVDQPGGNGLVHIWQEQRWLTFNSCSRSTVVGMQHHWRQGAQQALDVAAEAYSPTYVARMLSMAFTLIECADEFDACHGPHVPTHWVPITPEELTDKLRLVVDKIRHSNNVQIRQMAVDLEPVMTRKDGADAC